MGRHDDMIPATVPVGGWHFGEHDWDVLLVPLESGDMDGADAAIRTGILHHIGRRHGPGRIRNRLARTMQAAVLG